MLRIDQKEGKIEARRPYSTIGIQERNDSDLESDGSSGGSKKWSPCGFVV